jgi:hypothetical protein
MAEDLEDEVGTVEVFKGAAERLGLNINVDKTKIMRMSRSDEPVPQTIQCAGMELETVNSFKYLGAQVNSVNEVKSEILDRIASGARCRYGLSSIMNSSLISRKTKIRAYEVIVRPVVTYGSETWRLTKELERRLMVFENSMLRSICGPVYDAEEDRWRRRHNADLRDMTGVIPITHVIAAQRLRWAGHVARSDQDSLLYWALNERPEGRRPVGRPRMRWEDTVKKDVMAGGIEEEWKDHAQDRGRWRGLVVAAKSLQGLRPQE